jgi:polyhydroxybutyrate depolymerase
VHLPPSYDGSPLPLIIAMHGGLGSALNIEKQSKLSDKCDRANFIVVYPEGVKSRLGIRTWNAGECCGYASTQNIDDVGFIRVLIDTLMSKIQIDSNRIYATGMSNGGFMSYRLACELSDKIAAIAPVAASMTMPVCNPERPVPVMQFHSTQDANIPAIGGVGDGLSTHYNPPLDSVLGSFGSKASCLSKNSIQSQPYSYSIWTSCSCDVVMEYFLTTDGGHSWPGGTKTATGDPVSQQIDASDSMIRFFNQHSKICKTSNLVEVIDPRLIVYPVPADGVLHMKGFNEKITELQVTDLQGRRVLDMSHLLDKNTIDVTALGPGMYYLQLNQGHLRRVLILR